MEESNWFDRPKKKRIKKIAPITRLHTIPKIIHQTYIRNNHLPKEIKNNIDNLKRLNPGWSYRLYDDNEVEAYIKKYFPELLKYYLAINKNYGAARADFFRYLVMYRDGGVYIDIKSTFTKPFSEVLKDDDEYIISHWNYGTWGMHEEVDLPLGEYQQCYIIAAPGHPFLKAVIDKVVDNITNYSDGGLPTSSNRKIGKYGTLNTTGPFAYTHAISRIIDKYKHRMVDSVKDLGFKYTVFSVRNTGRHYRMFKKHYTNLLEPIVNKDILK